MAGLEAAFTAEADFSQYQYAYPDHHLHPGMKSAE